MAPDLKSTPPPSALARRREEFLGISLVAPGLLLLAALVSYHPNDPSLFSAVNDQGLRPRNWAGRFGASFADGSLQFFGLAAFVAPLALLAVGGRVGHEGPGRSSRRADDRASRAPRLRAPARVRRRARRRRFRGRSPRG